MDVNDYPDTNNLENDNFDESSLYLDRNAISFLKETSKWTKFISIVGFIMIGLAILGILIAAIGIIVGGSQMGGAMTAFPAFLLFIYAVLLGIYIFPILYLYRFSSNMSDAIASENNKFLSESFSNLKSHYKFMGIMLIIGLAIYALMFILLLLGAGAGFLGTLF
jgi:hypothetical protein